MPKIPEGELRRTAEGFAARITIKGKERGTYALTSCASEAEADARKLLLASMARRFRKARVIDSDDARKLLEMAATASTPVMLEGVLQVADQLVGGKLPPKDAEAPKPTFSDVAKQWTTGELHKLHPDHVKEKDAELDRQRLAKLNAVDVGGIKLGDIPIDRFKLDHAEAAMRQLPPEAKRPATRRQYAQLIRRPLELAVYPLRLIKTSPIPRGWLPKVGKPPAFPYLYRDEDAALMACAGDGAGNPGVPICWRMLFGFLAREGCRKSEAAPMRFGHEIDLDRGTCTLDENKTDDPRAWALDPGVLRALRCWRDMRKAEKGDLVFADALGAALDVDHLADKLRDALRLAGVDRAELFERGANRGRLRAHDLRSTFITLALANGRTETWVQDRTGHTTSGMINRYRRQARQANELGAGWLAPLDEAVPELAAQAPTQKVGGNHCPAIAPEPAAKGSRIGPTAARKYMKEETECTRRDSNSQGFPRRNLNPSEAPTVSQPSENRDSATNEDDRVATEKGQSEGNRTSRPDAVEAALASALERASAAGEWTTVRTLAAELEARRKARSVPEIVDLEAERRKRRDPR